MRSEPSRLEVVWAAAGLLAVLVGLIAFLVGSSVMFTGHAADCQGEAMAPGERCGPVMAMQVDPGAGRSYEDVERETTIRRTVGYAGVGLAVSGVASTVVIIRRNRRRNDALLLAQAGQAARRGPSPEQPGREPRAG